MGLVRVLVEVALGQPVDDLREAEPLVALALVDLLAVEQVFYHCSKAFLRSHLWEPESWGGTDLASRAVIARTLERPDVALEALEQYYGTDYAQGLYEQRRTDLPTTR